MEGLNQMTTTELIRQWAIDRGLDKSNPHTQMVKLVEELGELASGMARQDTNKIIDSIGDMYVVMTILAKLYDLDIEFCIDEAYDTIKDRKGKLVNGVFIKEEE
jgi:NTP pyrophosphatase (non-canonical NTP hydrolase)